MIIVDLMIRLKSSARKGSIRYDQSDGTVDDKCAEWGAHRESSGLVVKKFIDSNETVVLRRWESETRKFGFIKLIKVKLPL